MEARKASSDSIFGSDQDTGSSFRPPRTRLTGYSSLEPGSEAVVPAARGKHAASPVPPS